MLKFSTRGTVSWWVYMPGVIFTLRKWHQDLSTGEKKILKQNQSFIATQGK